MLMMMMMMVCVCVCVCVCMYVRMRACVCASMDLGWMGNVTRACLSVYTYEFHTLYS